MRSVFFISLLATIVFGVSHWYISTAHMCPVPLSYRLGEIDSRFLIEPEAVATVLAEAAAVWEDGTGRVLFREDPGARLTVNLIFDERQQLARTQEEWQVRLDQEEARYQVILAEVEGLAAAYEAAQARYETERTVYENALAAYNTEVDRYNQEGGAPESEFSRLQAEQTSLNARARALSQREQELNQQIRDINRRGEAANALITTYNAEVEEYNALFGSRDTFTQGEFGREQISIYKFSDEAELRRVLAHELGHALGIGHVAGEESVMYHLLTESAGPAALSATDLAAFTAVCGEEATFTQTLRHWLRTVLPN